MGDHALGGDRAVGEQLEGLAGVQRPGRVAGLDRDLPEEHLVGVEGERRARRERREQLDHPAAVDRLHGELEGARRAGAHQHHVRSHSHGLEDRAGGRLGGERARACGRRAARSERLGDDDQPASSRPGGLHVQQSHLPGAHHEQARLRAHAGAPLGPHAAGQRLDQRRRLGRHVLGDGQEVQARVLGRDEDLLGKAARVDPGLLEDLAERVVAAPAPVAHQARDVVVDGDAGAQREVAACGEGLAERDHLAYQFVPQHDGCLARHVPVQQVAAADPAGEHPHHHLARAGRGQGALLDAHVTRCVIDAGLHAPS